MFGQKKLEVYEDRNALAITLKWFTPIAIFLLFFTIVWDGFLVFWYSLAFSGEAPWIMGLFPVVHVAVGVYLTYYTLCLLFNKTFIDIAGNYLTVVHKPIPWWRGNRKVPVNAISQLYVVEKKSSGKNGTTYTYELRAKMYDQNDIEILALDGASAEDVQRIEGHLEKFLGINDEPVKGEYGRGDMPLLPVVQPRRQARNFADPALSTVYLAREGSDIDLKNEGLQVGSIVQFDWDDGNSDKLLQLISPEGEERLLFLEQKNALLKAYQERELNLFETNLPRFQLDNPPASIKVGEAEYFPTHFKTGKYFSTGSASSVDVKQWHYATRNQLSFLRIVNFGQSLNLYQGEALQASDFRDSLDLDRPPRREPETRTRGWKEEDLV